MILWKVKSHLDLEREFLESQITLLREIIAKSNHVLLF
jgi:hypothetical protein